MKLYLVQHAEAMDKEQNPDRPLTEAGRRDAENVAALAGRMELGIKQIRHSGKTRARQTAEILGQALSPLAGVVAVSGLKPLDGVAPVAHELAVLSEPLMLVGHLPFMEKLAGLLLAGDEERAVVNFTKAAIVCLAQDGELWQVEWVLTPQMAGLCRP